MRIPSSADAGMIAVDRNAEEIKTLKSFLCGIDSGIKLTNEYRARRDIVLKLSDSHKTLQGYHKELRTCKDSEVNQIWMQIRRIENECIAFTKKKMKSDAVLCLLIDALDDAISDDTSGSTAELIPRIKGCQSFFLSCICSANNNFYIQVKEKATDASRELVIDTEGDTEIYGIRHKIASAE